MKKISGIARFLLALALTGCTLNEGRNGIVGVKEKVNFQGTADLSGLLIIGCIGQLPLDGICERHENAIYPFYEGGLQARLKIVVQGVDGEQELIIENTSVLEGEWFEMPGLPVMSADFEGLLPETFIVGTYNQEFGNTVALCANPNWRNASEVRMLPHPISGDIVEAGVWSLEFARGYCPSLDLETVMPTGRKERF